VQEPRSRDRETRIRRSFGWLRRSDLPRSRLQRSYNSNTRAFRRGGAAATAKPGFDEPSADCVAGDPHSRLQRSYNSNSAPRFS
jgi:hypothetical protein